MDKAWLEQEGPEIGGNPRPAKEMEGGRSESDSNLARHGSNEKEELRPQMLGPHVRQEQDALGRRSPRAFVIDPEAFEGLEVLPLRDRRQRVMEMLSSGQGTLLSEEDSARVLGQGKAKGKLLVLGMLSRFVDRVLGWLRG